ncbi:hypothetical protein RJ640_003639 [Escallonia rubra]|uniref:Uncharacterized protein n=1 Tax=Escallonia rubra TaxID=112253 RepID=A0AA88S1F8_9ASTE|nr:hypothetical protein RJ640_003639 [Escallonia rubra]
MDEISKAMSVPVEELMKRAHTCYNWKSGCHFTRFESDMLADHTFTYVGEFVSHDYKSSKTTFQ